MYLIVSDPEYLAHDSGFSVAVTLVCLSSVFELWICKDVMHGLGTGHSQEMVYYLI